MTTGEPVGEQAKSESLPQKPTKDLGVKKEGEVPAKATVLAHKTIMDNPNLFGVRSGDKERPLDIFTTGNLANDIFAFGLSYFEGSQYHINLRGSTVRKSARDMLTPSNFDPTKQSYDEWQGRLLRIPDSTIKLALRNRFHAALEELPLEIRSSYEHIFLSGSDVDIQINPNAQQESDSVPADFMNDLFTHFLPALSRSIASDEAKTHPLSTMQHMQAVARQKEPAEQNSIPGLEELSDLSDGTYIAVLDKRIGVVDESGKLSGTESPKTIIYARKIPIHDGLITVAQLIVAADRRKDPSQPISLATIDQDMQPILTMQFNTSLDSVDEMTKYDSRTSLAATSYDQVQADLGITTDTDNLYVRFKEIGQTEDAPQATITMDRDRLKIFTEPVTLGPLWGDRNNEKLRNPVDDLEIATRAMWQAIDAETNEYYPNRHPTNYIEDSTLQDISNFIDQHPNLLQSLQAEENTFRRGMIQDNLRLSMLLSPHRFLEYTLKSGIGKLLFPQIPDGDLSKFMTNAQRQLSEGDEGISSSDYRENMFGVTGNNTSEVLGFMDPENALAYLAQHPDVKPTREIAQKIIGSGIPGLLQRYTEAYPTQTYEEALGPTGLELIHNLFFPDASQDYKTMLANLYYLTNIGYN